MKKLIALLRKLWLKALWNTIRTLAATIMGIIMTETAVTTTARITIARGIDRCICCLICF